MSSNRILQISEGISLCLFLPEQSNFLASDWENASFIMQVDPLIYDVPFSRPFTVLCALTIQGIIHEPTNREHRCEVSYQMTEDMRILYTFERSDYQVQRFTEFDMRVRDWIEHHLVPAFLWPDASYAPSENQDKE